MSKLSWKLKNLMAREEEEEEAAVVGKKTYICPYCQKEFSNGKAYGGHKRSHNLTNNNNKGHLYEDKIQISNSKNHEEGLGDLVRVDNQCPRCDKKFSSEKSLYGHMKNHRDHRTKTSSSSIVSVDMAGKEHEKTDEIDAEKGLAFDVSKTLPAGWSKAGKRGRIGRKGPMHINQLSLSHDAAWNLLALANAKPANETLPPKKRKSYLSAIGDVKNSPPEKLKSLESFSKSKNQSQEVSENDDNGKGKGKAPLANVVSDDDDDNTTYTPVTSPKHVCSICNRSFKSYQAMGGHKAHHGRKEGSSTPSIDECSSADDEHPRALRHKCPFCSKTFSKGQALGGHKRHCKTIARLNEASHGDEVKKRTHRRDISFDLNKLPNNGKQKKAGKAMENQETLSLPYHELGAEQDTYSSGSPS